MNKFCDQYSEDDMHKEVSEISSCDLDPLTQIANRQKFDEMFTKAINKSRTTVCYLSMLMIDIDYLKTLDTNDGQSSGEDCQRQVAAILKETLKRSGDLAAHWDYGRFACILSDTDSTGTLEMAEKIRKKVFDLAIPNPVSTVADVVTVSVGVVTAILTDETSYDTLLKKASQALSTAREMGRNRIEIYHN